jgi:hypothetical protein
MNMSSMLKLFISEKLFLEAELQHIEALRGQGKAYQPAADFREEALKRIQSKRKSLLISALWVLFLVLAGAVIARAVDSYIVVPTSWIVSVRTTSVVCIVWAVWSRLGDIETMKKETLLELTSEYIWKSFYSLGVFLGAAALFLGGP